MGNGFTFPLQSLIFAAAAISVCEYLKLGSEYVGVFGDDVVLPTPAAALFAEFCTFLGFELNASKSFVEGHFRESCGTHYLRGLDVKPIFLKKALSNVESLYTLANNVRRLAHRWGFGLGCDARFRQCWSFIRRKAPKRLRTPICEGFGDGGFICNFDEAIPPIRRAQGQMEGYTFLALVRVGVSRISEDLACLLDHLFYTSSERKRGNSSYLRAVTKLRNVRVLTPRWVDLGPWI